MILRYDVASNSFKGTVENTTSGVLDRVRVEVHLSNGSELGPTMPVDMAAGAMMEVELPATARRAASTDPGEKGAVSTVPAARAGRMRPEGGESWIALDTSGSWVRCLHGAPHPGIYF